MDTHTLHAQIAAHDPAALEALAQAPLEVDASGRTAFDVALESNNLAAIEVLAKRPDALTFSAQASEEQKAITRIRANEEGFSTLDEHERYIAQPWGGKLPFKRTPLLAACRHRHRQAIELLLAAGGKPGSKDILRLTEMELCFYAGGLDLVEFFIEACHRHKRALTLNDDQLLLLMNDTERLKRILPLVKLAAKGKYLLLAYYCARLDLEAVQNLLATGLDPNKAHGEFVHPLEEACTSAMLHIHDLPDWLPFALNYARIFGAPKDGEFHIDHESSVPFETQLKEAEKAKRERRALIKNYVQTPQEHEEQEAQRLRIVDALLAAGLDPMLAYNKQPSWSSSLIQGEPQYAFIEQLLARGIILCPDSILDDDENDELPEWERQLLKDIRARFASNLPTNSQLE